MSSVYEPETPVNLQALLRDFEVGSDDSEEEPPSAKTENTPSEGVSDFIY